MKNCEKIKVGDRVEIIENSSKHHFKIGAIVEITKVNSIDYFAKDCQAAWWLSSQDIEKVCCNQESCKSSQNENSPIQKAIDYLEKIKGSESLDNQIGGSHYKKYTIQPFIFHRANGLKQAEANVIDYILRAKDKNGKEDLKKAIHYIEMIIDTDYE